MKPLKIAALGFAVLLAGAALVLGFGVPAGFVAKLAQDQVEARTGYRLRIEGGTKLSFRPSPTVTLDKVSLRDGSGNDSATSFTAQSVRASLSLASLVSGRPGITELAVVRPALRVALARQPVNRAGSVPARPRDGATAAAATVPAFTVDRLTVEDGSVVMSNARDRLEMRIDRIDLTASLGADDGRLDARAFVGDQPVRLQAKAGMPLAGFGGRSVPVELSFAAPGVLADVFTGAADIRAGASALMINNLAGTIGPGKVNGWASVDVSGKPLVKADFDMQRLDFAVSRAAVNAGAASGAAGGETRPRASQPWSGEAVRLVGLNYLDADLQFSAADLNVGALRLTPVAVHATLANGVLNAAMSRSGVYGGQVEGTASVDASGDIPAHTVRIDLAGVRALPLLSDVADFNAVDGRLQAKIDVRAAGASGRDVMSSLSGSADVRIQDGQILGINVPQMIRTLTAQTLTGWQENRTASTDLSDFSARFQIQGGRATTANLRLLGPLVRVTGAGTVDLAAQTLQFKLDPKLVASLEGQGGAVDPLGFGVPVNVEGSWTDPRIYPDVAGILSDPDGAYAKLHALGQGLFGKGPSQGPGQSGGQGGGLDSLLQGLGTLLGPRNDGKDNRNPPAGDKPSDRPSPNGSVGDFLRDLLGR
jgi:AsmA protein